MINSMTRIPFFLFGLLLGWINRFFQYASEQMEIGFRSSGFKDSNW